MTTDLRWLTQIPANAEDLHLVVTFTTGAGDYHRHALTGDAVAALVEEIGRLRRAADYAEACEGAADRAAVDLEDEREEVARLRADAALIQQEIGAWAMQPEDPETPERWHLADRTFGTWVCAENPTEPPDALTMVRAVLFDRREDRAYWRERVARGKAERALEDARAHIRRLEAQEQRLMREAEELRRALAAIRAAVGLPADDPWANVIEQIRRRAAALRASRSAHETTVGMSLRLQKMNDDLMATVEELRLTLAAEQGRREGVYIASRTRHGARWAALRDRGAPIISTWINEYTPASSPDVSNLWVRCVREAATAARLYAYIENDGLEGGLIEIGAALSMGVPVSVVCADEVWTALGSWKHHPLVNRAAMLAAEAATGAR